MINSVNNTNNVNGGKVAGSETLTWSVVNTGIYSHSGCAGAVRNKLYAWLEKPGGGGPGGPIYNENGPFLLLLDCFSAIAIVV